MLYSSVSRFVDLTVELTSLVKFTVGALILVDHFSPFVLLFDIVPVVVVTELVGCGLLTVLT